MSDPNVSEYKYWAFISYSHQDNLAVRGDGSGDRIQWANWLHEQLETYRVPDGYRDRTTATGEPMPERFFPTFRDEAELPTSHDLGGQIHDALRRSRLLIIIASPRSAAFRHVNEEVRFLLQRQNCAELAKKVIGRACNLVPANETYRLFASQL